MRLAVVSSVGCILFGAALFSCDKAKEEPAKVTTAVPVETLSVHNSSTDCWMAFNDTVYDVTSYLASHPGGSPVMTPFCGSDASEQFAGHSLAARDALKNLPTKGFLSGDVVDKIYTAAEIAAHNTVNDCWMTIGLRVYNVSGYLAETRPTDNKPYVHQGGLLPGATPTPTTEVKNAARRTAIVNKLCGKDVSYYFGESTIAVAGDLLDSYTFQVAQGETCPSHGTTTVTSGTSYLTTGTCTSGAQCTVGPCVIQTYAASGSTVATFAKDATCSTYGGSLPIGTQSTAYKISGTCASAAGTGACTAGPCVFMVPAGTSKQHTGASNRVFFESYYIGTIQ